MEEINGNENVAFLSGSDGGRVLASFGGPEPGVVGLESIK